MKSHKLYESAMRRGDARQTDRELGYRTEGEIARRWRRPVATRDNLVLTGKSAPLVKAKAQLLAHDRVRPETADILIFDLLAGVAMQRAKRRSDYTVGERGEVVSGVAEAFAGALRILLLPSPSTDEQEAALYFAGGKLVRALLFVMRDESSGHPRFKLAA